MYIVYPNPISQPSIGEFHFVIFWTLIRFKKKKLLSGSVFFFKFSVPAHQFFFPYILFITFLLDPVQIHIFRCGSVPLALKESQEMVDNEPITGNCFMRGTNLLIKLGRGGGVKHPGW